MAASVLYTSVAQPFDANGQRVKKTTQTGGSNPTMTVVNDTYQAGRLAYQTNLGGTLLATFTYDPSGVPESVVVGADPNNSPRYYYVYNGHGDVVALTDASGNVVASYSYDVWGNLTSSSENIPNANGWTNPYRYDGKDDARYDAETGLYWLATRAYDPTLGRFLQRDPLSRAPLFFGDTDQPYAYAGNNPPVNVDPSGERQVPITPGDFNPEYIPDPRHPNGIIKFCHGTTGKQLGRWGAQIDPGKGVGDFGYGYYTFWCNSFGERSAEDWARRKARDDGGYPAIVYSEMRWKDYRRLKKMYVGASRLDAVYRRYYPGGRTGYDLVIGWVGKNDGRGHRVPNYTLPVQYKFESTRSISMFFGSHMHMIGR